MIGKWKDKRDVIYISSEFKNDMIPTTNRKNKKKIKLLPIKYYNQFMSGIDRQDQMMSYYPFIRKSIRLYKKLGVYIIQMLQIRTIYVINITLEQNRAFMTFA